MAHADEALDLKRRARRRLIGAIALVLFLVIVPPWIMDLEPQPVETTLEVDIPKPDDRPLPATPPVTESVAPEQPDVAAPEKIEPQAPAAEAPVAPQTESPKQTAKPATPRSEAKPEAKAEAKTEASPGAKGEAYVVPVATLSSKEGVKELQAKLSLAGLESYTEPIKTGSGQYTRVRAGPYASKAEAEKVHARLREMGLKPGNVTTR